MRQVCTASRGSRDRLGTPFHFVSYDPKPRPARDLWWPVTTAALLERGRRSHLADPLVRNCSRELGTVQMEPPQNPSPSPRSASATSAGRWAVRRRLTESPGTPQSACRGTWGEVG